MKKNSCKKDDSSHCFSSMLQRMVCGRNLPTNPSPSVPINLKKTGEVTTFSNILSKNGPNPSQIQVQGPVQTPAEAKCPSIVARLMGLESMPENNTNNNNYEYLFRSKSLNSLHFYPDFNPTRASLPRRARKSASYHEQSHNNNLLLKIDENVENKGCLESKKPHKGSNGNVKRKKEGSRDNVVTLKGNERRISRKNVNNNNNKKKRYEQRFTNSESSSGSTSSSVSNRLGMKYNVGYNMRNNEKMKLNVKKNKDKKVKINNGSVGTNNGASMRKVDYKEEMNVEFQSDATSRSPVSVLDQHYCHLFDSPAKENERQVASHSVSEEMSAPKSKKKDKSSKKLGHKQKLEVAHYFVDLLAQIYSVVEDHVRDPKWMTKYQRSKAHFTDELCVHFGDEMLDFLLLELMYDLIE